ncbi:MAG: AAA family ATPase [Nanoarchaeota archaeon]|nr:AAA family ATPase [Nanoarchaeota archaeon]MBU1005907.1 AAA family ATPase [Nanoarchaeota archaeon]MBU1945388.1 AAA family ATPase [Nanoarchaeota archaeon]
MTLTDLVNGKGMVWVTGKGGVGKSTLAAALSLHLATNGSHVMANDVDPAHSLPDAFGIDMPDDN